MKKQLSITALSCSALLAFTNPVNAEEWRWSLGEVYYCESESGAFAQDKSDWKFTRWTPIKFRFKIDGYGDYKNIKFGEGGYFDGFYLDIVKASYGTSYLKGSSLGMTFLLNRERFKFTEINADNVAMMTGTCDKF